MRGFGQAGAGPDATGLRRDDTHIGKHTPRQILPQHRSQVKQVGFIRSSGNGVPFIHPISHVFLIDQNALFEIEDSLLQSLCAVYDK